jgi:transposase
MARRRKSKTRSQARTLNIMHTQAAGIDVGSPFHVVAVPPHLSPEPVQILQSFTGDLYRLANWLVEIGVTPVAMESTGIDGIPVCEILAAHGLEVLLVHARHGKHVPGRKTDVRDAQWMQPLHS